MGVIVDESGQNRRTAKIYRLRAGWNSRRKLGSRPDGNDAVAFDNYSDIVLYDIGLSIDHVRRANHIRARRGGLRGALSRREARVSKQESQRDT
jgi:hypothetical protein